MAKRVRMAAPGYLPVVVYYCEKVTTGPLGVTLDDAMRKKGALVQTASEAAELILEVDEWVAVGTVYILTGIVEVLDWVGDPPIPTGGSDDGLR